VVEDELGQLLGGVIFASLEPVGTDAKALRELAQCSHRRSPRTGFDTADVGVADAGRSEITL
jgi:hypothetical protein